MTSPDCIIIGGGAVGCSMGLLLARQGLTPLIIEQQPQASPPSPSAALVRTTALNSGTIECLDNLSVWPHLKPHATPINTVHVALADKANLSFASDPSYTYPMGAIIDNARLRHELHNSTAAFLLSGTRIADISRDNNRVTLTTDSGHQFHTALLIAADGRQSRSAEFFGLTPQRHDYQQTAITAVIRHEQPHHNTAFELFTPAGTLALLPMAGHTSTLVWNAENTHAADLMHMSDNWFCGAATRAVHSITGAITLISKREAIPLLQLLLPQLAAPRVVALGDAAHRIHPLAGQGLNLGMRDALALADIIVKTARTGGDIGAAATIERYAARRILDIRSMAGATFTLNALFRSNSPIVKKGLETGLKILNHSPSSSRFFMRHAAGFSRFAQLSTTGINTAKT